MKAVLLGVMLLLTGCSLNITGGTATQEATPAQVVLVSTSTAESTALPNPTAPPGVVPQSGVAEQAQPSSPTAQPCTPRRDWSYSYIVQRGDTLFSIARASSTTVDALVLGNCLADPDTISAGQVLILPAQPTFIVTPLNPPLPTALSIPQSPAGALDVSPATLQGPSHYVVAPNTAFTIRWTGYGPNPSVPAQIEFTYLVPESTLPNSIGIDTTLTDGASITWTLPAGSDVIVTASARLAGELHQVFFSPDIRITTG